MPTTKISPSHSGLSSDETRDRIIALHHKLRNATSLRPGPQVNEAFTELVQLSSSSSHRTAQRLLNDEGIQAIIPDLRLLCSAGEGELERHWAAEILASQHPVIALEQFPYYDNYLKLTELEYRSLSLIGARPIRNVLFVGSGPLPLSSILLARQYGLLVDNLDNDAAAVDLSQQLVGRLGLGDVVNIECAEADTFAGYDRYDAIFLASLVGLEQSQKQTIIGAIRDRMKPGALLVVRTAHDLRTLLYPEVEIDDIEGLKPQVVIQPLNEIVNSVIILEKPYQSISDEIILEDKTNPGAIARFQQFSREAIADVYRYPHHPVWHFDIDQAESVYGQDDSNIFILRHGSDVLAAAAIRPYDRDYAMFTARYDRTTGSIWRFFVKPQYAHLQLDQILQRRIETFAQEVGFAKLYAHDQRDIPGALRKYVRNGYQVTYESTDSFGTVHFEKNLEKPQ